MRTNQTRWVLAACITIALAGVGCGDDEDPTPIAGTGGSSGTGAGAGGMSGGGAGGAAGMTGTPTVAQCVAAVATATMNRTPTPCATCACMNNVTAVTACNNNAACWALIGCIRDNCPNDPMSGCAAQPPCAQYITGATTAGGVGPILRGACAAQCITTGGDSGTEDAGI